MPNTPRMNWPYPAENQESWYEAFKTFVESMDASGFAAREDRQLILSGGNVVSWDGASSILQWTGTINLVSPITGFQVQIAPATVTVQDGQVVYAVLTRAPTRNVTVAAVIAGQVPNTDTAIVLCVRVGNRLYWRNGLLFDSGESVTNLGAKQGGGGGSPLQVDDEGAPLVANCNLMDFVGAGVNVVVTAPNQVQVNVPGGATGVASGDLSGNYPSPTVDKIQGLEVFDSIAPVNGDALTWDGPNSRWDATTPGTTSDRRTAYYVVGNAPNGDTAVVCDYLDAGDGVQLVAALAAAGAGRDVYVRPGLYDLGAGVAASPFIVPAGVHMRGAGRGHTFLRTKSTDQGALLINALAAAEDLTVEVSLPTAPCVGQIAPVMLNDALAECHRVGIRFLGVYTVTEANYSILYGAFGLNVLAEDCKLIDCTVGQKTTPAPSFIAFGKLVPSSLRAVYVPNISGLLNILDVRGFISHGADIGIEFASKCRALDFTIYDAFQYGVRLAAPSGCSVANGEVNMVANGGTEVGVWFEAATDCDVDGIRVIASTGAPGTKAVEMTSSSRNIVRGVRASAGWGYGADLDAASGGNIVNANQLSLATTPVRDLGAGNDVAHNL